MTSPKMLLNGVPGVWREDTLYPESLLHYKYSAVHKHFTNNGFPGIFEVVETM